MDLQDLVLSYGMLQFNTIFRICTKNNSESMTENQTFPSPSVTSQYVRKFNIESFMNKMVKHFSFHGIKSIILNII